ncbi:hypothetical protein COLO4_23829 [Corchorus olitorius]|uniref:TPX2 central domain-containing protein n=1 Tax=Corchorus olitorius TaxID=93759 RepID=A0A1R3IEE4_9ROSI|nr:hypothetical protein COLO4_23829 [Corchorus olitorius]
MRKSVSLFEVREIDLDYEFDAARFFDFTREESPAEAREAELWFEAAPSCPPSPFVAKLVLREDSLLENVGTSPKCKEVEDTRTLENYSENDTALEFSAMAASNRGIEGTNRGIFADIQKVLQKALNQPFQLTSGFTNYNHTTSDKLKPKSKNVKLFSTRSSTLMKPTASQLAKQNRPPQAAASRFQKLQTLNSDRSLGNSSVVESQAAKRQKLEGGLSHKVADVKEQTSFIHKAPKKLEGAVDRSSNNNKLKLTIPREPELETAHRAQRMRPKNSTEQEHVPSVMHRFKARPLNRKILEAPSLPLPKKSTPKLPEFQEFHLKTSERAVQFSSTVSSSSFHSNDADKRSVKAGTSSATDNGTRATRRPSVMDATRQDDSEIRYNFKARPLNKKIFSSKGDIGIFRNIKKETTVPMEFNFHTEKRAQQNVPIDLFSKLSLTSELQPSNGTQIKLRRPTFIATKGSKENRSTSFQPGHEIRNFEKEKPHAVGGKNNQCATDGYITEVGNHLSTRSLGIR